MESAPLIPQNKYKLSQKIANSLLLFTIVLIYVPLNPRMPTADRDGSWAYAMNEAVARHLIFGKDIVFTFGPYASVYTKVYHPGIDCLAITGSLTLGTFAAILIFYLTRSLSVIWKFSFTCLLAAGLHSMDAQLFLYPLLVSFCIYRVSLYKKDEIIFSAGSNIFYVLIFIPFGLLLLIKGSLILLIIGVTVLSTALCWYKNLKKTAVAIFFTPLLSLVFFQILAGQPVTGLYSYFTNLLPIIGGYSEAMNETGRRMEIVLFVPTAFLILLFCYKTKNIPYAGRLLLTCTLALYCLTAFKYGFSRQFGHSIAAGSAILLAAFLLFTVKQNKQLYLLFILSLVTWQRTSFYFPSKGLIGLLQGLPTIYIESLAGLQKRFTGENQLKKKYIECIQIADTIKLPVLKGTTDLYSYDQFFLLTTNNIWQPRPIIQSYSAYTSTLARINEAHLTGKQAPHNIFFKVQPIDYRLPPMDDGLSWPTLFTNYRLTDSTNGFLILQQKRTVNTQPERKEIYTIKCTMGQKVQLPDTTHLLFAQFDIGHNVPGGLLSAIFKPNLLIIKITLIDGKIVKYRFIPGMGKAGCIFSPLIENTSEFGMFFNSTYNLKNKYVKSFSIENDPNDASYIFNCWKPDYTLHLSKIIYDQ